MLAAWQLDEAMLIYRRILSADLGNADANHNLGLALVRARRVDEAVVHLRRALQVRPGWDSALFILGLALEEVGDSVGAKEALREVATGRLGNAAMAVHVDALGPLVFEHADAIDDYLVELDHVLDHHLDRSSDAISALNATQLIDSNARPPFSLAYLGRDVRPLLEKWSQVFAPRFAARPDPIEPTASRRRVGWVVTPGHQETFIISRLSLLEQLDPDQFEVLVFACSGVSADRLQAVVSDRIRIVQCDPALDEMAATVRAEACHVVLFWECGTDTLNYFLAFERLAIVQTLDWGTPHTSGVATIDHYVSSAILEPVDADDHYVEKLVRLDAIPAFLERRELSADSLTRADLGLATDRHLYVCAQNPLKLHPDFDQVLADIVEQDPAAEIVLLNKAPVQAAKVQQRLERTIPDAVKRVMWADTTDRRVYLSLLNLADVCLDPPHYSGMNISYETFQLGTPVVCSRSPFMRGRYTAALADRMDLPELVAPSIESLGTRAVELTQPDVNAELRATLTERNDVLFENAEAVNAFSDYLASAEPSL